MIIEPITSENRFLVAEFLHKNLHSKISVEQWVQGLFPKWSENFSNHGHMMMDNNQIVGVQIVIHSKFLIGEKESTFGNLSSWCVLEEYRKGLNSIMLLRKNISDKNVNYTVTTPNETAQNILSKFGFKLIDNSIYVTPNLPIPYSPHRIISSKTENFVEHLNKSNLRVYNDHNYIPWLKHLVIKEGKKTCYVIYREWHGRHISFLRNIRILYISDAEIFQKNLFYLRGYFFFRGYPAITISKRLIIKKPFLSIKRDLTSPLCYRESDQPIDYFTNAYTQIMTFEKYY